jgi:hypothetical protein
MAARFVNVPADAVHLTYSNTKNGAIMNARNVTQKLEKVYRFPDGTMTEKQWVEQYADRLEYKAAHDPYEGYSRTKFNRLEGAAQNAYIKRLARKNALPSYRAYRRNGSSFQEISKSTFEWAAKTLGLPVS